VKKPQVVVVGGGFGGLNVAKALAGAKVDVTIVDRENHHLFQPLLYQVATASLAPGSIAVPIRSVVSRQDNVRVVLAEAQRIEKDERLLRFRDGSSLPYDYLVVACGAKTTYFGHDEWAEHAHGLKDLRDAIRIRERVLLAFEAAEWEADDELRKGILTFVVIGGGPTGVEMAGAISELGRQVLVGDYRRVRRDDVRVVLVEMGARVLSAFDPDLSQSAQRQLEELGVEVRTATKVTDVTPAGVRLGDEWVEASVVVWAAGVTPVSFVSRLGVPLDRSGRIVVDEHCALPDHPEIFALGDVAAFVPEGEERALPGVAPVAVQQGKHVARQIRRDLRGKARERFVYRDKGIMATIGRSRAVVQGSIKLTGLLAWWAWGLIHVLYLIGFRNRFIVLFNWLWSYLTFKRGARLITARHDEGDATTPVRLRDRPPDPLRHGPAHPGSPRKDPELR